MGKKVLRSGQQSSRPAHGSVVHEHPPCTRPRSTTEKDRISGLGTLLRRAFSDQADDIGLHDLIAKLDRLEG
jgi:hypothetical protein